jgi:hypothetical protein
MKTHRAVEALRIAMGLGSHNEGQDLTLILSGRSPFLLAEDTSEIVGAETLEKYLPTYIEWHTPFIIAPSAEFPTRLAPDIITKPITEAEIPSSLEAADRVLVF